MRFPIYNSFNGALFVDVGNIWTYHSNELLPSGEFYWNYFYKQLAVDAGLGIRLDLNVAVVRVDIAMPLRNPYSDNDGYFWRFHSMNLSDLNFVFNLGYPF